MTEKKTTWKDRFKGVVDWARSFFMPKNGVKLRLVAPGVKMKIHVELDVTEDGVPNPDLYSGLVDVVAEAMEMPLGEREVDENGEVRSPAGHLQVQDPETGEWRDATMADLVEDNETIEKAIAESVEEDEAAEETEETPAEAKD